MHDLHVQCLRVTVVDSDWGLGRDDPLGHCEVRQCSENKANAVAVAVAVAVFRRRTR